MSMMLPLTNWQGHQAAHPTDGDRNMVNKERLRYTQRTLSVIDLVRLSTFVLLSVEATCPCNEWCVWCKSVMRSQNTLRSVQSSQRTDLLRNFRVYNLIHTKIVQTTRQRIKIARYNLWTPEGCSKFGATPRGGFRAGVSRGRASISIPAGSGKGWRAM